MSTNLFINEFIEDKQNASKANLSFTKNNCIRISENIIDINPVPIFVKTQINDYAEINNEFHILAANIPEEQLYINKNQDPNKKSGIFTSQNAYVPYNNILNNDNIYIELLKSHILNGMNELVSTLYNYKGDYKYTILN